MNSECPYNIKQDLCDIEVECIVLQETINEATELYYAMRDENQYLRERIQLLEDILRYYGIRIPPED